MKASIVEVTDSFRVREVHLSTGNKYIINQTDPYGFWKIHMEKGQIPEVLDQHFTEPGLAIKAIEGYLESDKKAVKEPDETSRNSGRK